MQTCIEDKPGMLTLSFAYIPYASGPNKEVKKKRYISIQNNQLTRLTKRRPAIN